MLPFDVKISTSAFEFEIFLTDNIMAARAAKGPSVLSAKEIEMKALLFGLMLSKEVDNLKSSCSWMQ